MPNYEIEMLWDCPRCDTDAIGGTVDNCPNCGAAHDTKESPWYMPGDTSFKARIRDARKLRMARDGANWTCARCDGTQRNADGNCLNCAAPRHEPVAPEPTVSPPAPSGIPEARSSGGGPRRPASVRAPMLARPPVPPRRPVQPVYEDIHDSPSGDDWLMVKILGGLSAAAAVVGFVCWALFHQELVNIQVSSVHWEQVTSVERYQQVAQDGFKENRPADAENVRENGQKIHHYDHVFDHTEIEHYSETVQDPPTCVDIPKTCTTTQPVCTPTGNGTANCSGGDTVCSGGGKSCTPNSHLEDRTRNKDIYRDDPVYAMSYTWTVWRWVHNRDVPHAGGTTETSWPSDDEICLECNVRVGEKERVSGKRGSYKVNFIDPKHADSYDYEPKSEGEFRRFPIRSEHQAMYSVAGGLDFQSAIHAD